MRLCEASLLDFRNLAEVRLDFSPGVNVFLGDNGQGKSNLLEALNYPALGRSYRGAADRDLVAFGRPAARVRIAAQEDDASARIFEYDLRSDGRHDIRIDGETLRRKHHLVGGLHTVVYDPQTVELVRGGPENRRRFLDAGLCGLDRDYLHSLRRYRRALRQKLRLLYDMKRGFHAAASLRSDLEIWNREMADHAAPLLSARAVYVRDLAAAAARIHGVLTGGDESLQLVYSQGIEMGQKDHAETDLRGEILRVLSIL